MDYQPQDFSVQPPEPTADEMAQALGLSMDTAPKKTTSEFTDATSAAKVAHIGSDDPQEQLTIYDQVRAQRAASPYGQSDIQDMILQKRNEAEANNAKYTTAQMMVDGVVPPDQAKNALLNYTQSLPDKNLNQHFVEDQALKANPQGVEAQAKLDGIGFDHIDNYVKAQANIQRALNKNLMETTTDGTKAYLGTMASLLPFINSEQDREITTAWLKQAENTPNFKLAGQGALSFLWKSKIQDIFYNSMDELAKKDPAKYEEIATSIIQSHNMPGTITTGAYGDISNAMKMEEVFGRDPGSYNKETPAFYSNYVAPTIETLSKGGFANGAIGTVAQLLNWSVKNFGWDHTVDNLSAAADYIPAGTEAVKLAKGGASWLKYEGTGIKILDKAIVEAAQNKSRTVQDVADIIAGNVQRSDAVRNSILHPTSPLSPADLTKEVNPDQTRKMYEMGAKDPEASKALFGTAEPMDVVAEAHAPQVNAVDGSVKDRVTPFQAIDEIVEAGNPLAISAEERAAAKAKIEENLANVDGLQLRKNMSSIETEANKVDLVEGVSPVNVQGARVSINAVYGPLDGGFKNIQSVIDRVAFAVKGLGLSADNIRILAKKAGRYYKLSPEEVDSIQKGENAKQAIAMHQSEMANYDWQSKVVANRNEKMKAEYEAQLEARRVAVEQAKAAAKVGEKRTAAVGKDLFAKGPEIPPVPEPQYLPMPKKPRDLPKDVMKHTKPHGYEDYLIQVSDSRLLHPEDLSGGMSNFTVKNNFMDRWFSRWTKPTFASAGKGSIMQNILTAASMFKDMFVDKALGNAYDKAAHMEDLLAKIAIDFQKSFEALGKDSQVKFKEWVVKANREGLSFLPDEMRLQQWTEEAIAAHYKFRNLCDKLHSLENAYYVKSLRLKGFGLLEDKANGLKVYAKKISRNMLSEHTNKRGITVFDHEENRVRNMSHKELKALYDKDGSIQKGLRTEMIDGQPVDYYIDHNQYGRSYSRALKDGDVVLPYRDGWVPRRYTHKYFVRQTFRDAKGEVMFVRAIGSAETRQEAEALQRVLRETNPDVHPDDINWSFNKDDLNQRQMDMIDINHASGRSAQKIRGEQLVTNNISDEKLGFDNIQNPMEALVGSIKSLSNRINTRDWFDMTKQRFMENFSDLVPVDPITKQPRFPTSVEQIVDTSPQMLNGRRVGDARTVFNYINSMENGYINNIDKGINMLGKVVADVVGEKFGSKAEKVADAVVGDLKPMQRAKTLMAQMVIFGRPVRQAFLNNMQQMMLMGYARPGWLRPDIGFGQMMSVMLALGDSHVPDAIIKHVGWTRKEFEYITDSFLKSGFIQAVDKNNIVRGIIADLAERSAMNKFQKVVSSPFYAARRMIDHSQIYVDLSAYLAEMDRAKHAGKDIFNPEVEAEVQALARNFTGSMNAAGDQPYNHTELAFGLQFAQYSHKIMDLMFLNQHLTLKQKLRLGFTNLALFGFPLDTAIQYEIDKLYPDNEDARNAVSEGISGWAANQALDLAFDSKSRIDFSSGSAFGTPAVMTMATLLNSGFTVAMEKSIAGGKVFGSNPVLLRFGKQLLNYVVPQSNMLPSSPKSTAIAFAELFSGASDAMKAATILKEAEVKDSKGNVVDYNGDTIAVMAAVLGMPTEQITRDRAISYKLTQEKKSQLKDVDVWYNAFKQDLNLHGVDNNSPEAYQILFARGFQEFQKNPEQAQYLSKLINEGAARGEFDVINKIWEANNRHSIDESIHLLKETGPNTPQRDEALKAMLKAKEAGMFKYEDK